MTSYETLFVLKPTLTEEETTAQINKVVETLTNEGAELLATDRMGMRKLAYEVQKNARGYYTVLFYKAEGSIITEVERKLRINENVLKFLTVKYVKQKELAHFNKLVEVANKKANTTAETAEA
jgi:small subunit ribosomal protein S6